MKKEEWIKGEIAKWRSEGILENYYKLIEEFVEADNSATKSTKGTKDARLKEGVN